MIKLRLEALRKQMKQCNVDYYYVPTADFHQSEYVSEYFKTRQYLSGFTGSAGVLLVGQEDAWLWSDGRYFIQAETQLKDSGIVLMKQGEPGVPTLEEHISQLMMPKQVLGFDGRVVSASFGRWMEQDLTNKQASLQYDKDLVDAIWIDRPALPTDPAFLLDIKYAGKTTRDKISDVRKSMAKHQATHHLLSSLDDIAWLLNIRGNDVTHTPVVLSYVLVDNNQVYFYVDGNKLSEEIKTQFLQDGIVCLPYEQIYQDLHLLEVGAQVLVDENRINYALLQAIPQAIKVVRTNNPTTSMKAIKNETEQSNLRISHIKDGVAVTKLMMWLKQNIGTLPMSELSATAYLQAKRQEQEGYLDDSFSTICGYLDHAAMMHYSANEDSNYSLQAKGMLLVDSGGQYYQGTTDITRTFVLGELSNQQKQHFTAVVRGMLNLSQAKFLHGCTGLNLDILARGPLWDLGLDYRCGTGHGVGYLLSVHEGPQGFRWKPVAGKSESAILEPGMVITNEPGVYVEGSHGIRIENELIVSTRSNNEYGQFLEFETITMAPIDLDGIDPSLMTNKEREALNAYHIVVYQTIAPYLNPKEQALLAKYTRAI